jgi:hypothetical protein
MSSEVQDWHLASRLLVSGTVAKWDAQIEKSYHRSASARRLQFCFMPGKKPFQSRRSLEVASPQAWFAGEGLLSSLQQAQIVARGGCAAAHIVARSWYAAAHTAALQRRGPRGRRARPAIVVSGQLRQRGDLHA